MNRLLILELITTILYCCHPAPAYACTHNVLIFSQKFSPVIPIQKIQWMES